MEYLCILFVWAFLWSDAQDEDPQPVLPGHPEEDPGGRGDGGHVQIYQVGDMELIDTPSTQ